MLLEVSSIVASFLFELESLAHKMPASQEQAKLLDLVDKTIASLESVVQADSNCLIDELDCLERVNNGTAIKYRSIANAAQGLNTDATHLKAGYQDIRRYVAQVDEIEVQVAKIEALVKELDSWSRAVQTKCDRMQ